MTALKAVNSFCLLITEVVSLVTQPVGLNLYGTCGWEELLFGPSQSVPVYSSPTAINWIRSKPGPWIQSLATEVEEHKLK